MSLQLSNNNKNENGEKIDPENLIKDGIDIIYQSFNTNMENYIGQINELKKIIKDLNKKLQLMKEEMEMTQRENDYYKAKNKKLKNEVENLNKVVSNIKGKLINFDFNANTKQIFENISQENLGNKTSNKYNKNYRKNNHNIFNKNSIENDKYTINNSNFDKEIFYSDQTNRNINKELSRNSHTKRHEIKHSYFNDLDLLYESEMNSINDDDIMSEINSGNNIINQLNDDTNAKQLHTLYSDLNIRNKNRMHKRYYNEENSKNNYYKNNNRKSIVQRHINKKNINFNSYKNINTYRRKNKIRKNSLNSIIKNEKIKNDVKYLIKNNDEKNKAKDKEYIKLNLDPLLECSNNLDYNYPICKTFQDNIISNINNNNCIKELKMKEISFFIEKCKAYLENEELEIILKIFQKYKGEIIQNKNVIKQIKFYLKSNEELLNLFKL